MHRTSQSLQWILFVLFSFLFCEIFASHDTLEWTSQQGTSGYDGGYGVAVSGDGFIYVTGYTYDSLNGQPYKGNDAATIISSLLTYLLLRLR